MSVFGKLKNIFYDDEYVEEEPVKEVKPKIEEIKINKEEKVEKKPSIILDETEEIDIKPIKTDNTFSERELFKPEKTFPFTQFDDEEEELPKQRTNVLDLERTTRVSVSEPVDNEPKVFKPSPVISPIYGILDKDYKKEHIVERNNKSNDSVHSTTINYDTVRRKAYGTLEDELENTMSSVKIDKVTKSVNNISDEVDALENKASKIENLISEIEKTTSLSIGELEERAKDEMFDDTDEVGTLSSTKEIETVKEEKYDDDKTMTDNTLEHDLFNLIDSMYDDKED